MSEKTANWRRRLRRYAAPALLFGAIFGVAFAFRDVLVPFILALIIVYLMEPLVKRWHRIGVGKLRLPRWACVIFVYICFFGAVSLTSLVVVPPLAREFSNLASEAPEFFERLRTETVPRINRDVQGLIQRWFPPQLTDEQLDRAMNGVENARLRASAVAELTAALTPEEVEMFEIGGLAVEIETQGSVSEESWAFRLRQDADTGDWLVMLDDVELVAHPEQEGGFLLRSRQDERNDANAISFDLEEQLNHSLGDLAQRSGEGVAQLVSLGQGLIFGLMGAFLKIILTFMVAAFISIDLPGIMAFFRSTIPVQARDTYDKLIVQLDKGLSGVVRGQLMICVVNGTLTGIGLLLLGVKFALILALFATVLSLIPIFGTIISAVPAVAVALTQGITVAFLVLLWILMIHFVEANILNPKIIGGSAHIHPVLVVFALLAGEHTYGLLGALLAVPVLSICLTLFKFVLSRTMQAPVGPSEEAPT